MDRPLSAVLMVSLVQPPRPPCHDAAQGLVVDGNRDRLAAIGHLWRAQVLGSNRWLRCAPCSHRDAGRLRAEAGCLLSVWSAFQGLGRVLGDSDVATAPHHLATWPLAALALRQCVLASCLAHKALVAIVRFILELARAPRRGNDLDQLLGDHRLARALAYFMVRRWICRGHIAVALSIGASCAALLGGRVWSSAGREPAWRCRGAGRVGQDLGLVGLLIHKPVPPSEACGRSAPRGICAGI